MTARVARESVSEPGEGQAREHEQECAGYVRRPVARARRAGNELAAGVGHDPATSPLRMIEAMKGIRKAVPARGTLSMIDSVLTR